MSNLKKFQPAPATNDPIIAGKNSGVTVYCSSTALDTYNNLVSLGKNGNHWARLIVKGIEGLSSSRLSMDNVYTEKGKIAYGRGLFYVSLPGVMATFDALDNGAFKLTALNIDPDNKDYFQNQRTAQNPGLWQVKLVDNRWATRFVSDGRLLKKYNSRYVAISDTSFSDVNDAASYASAMLGGINASIKEDIVNYGFDMHYTPGIDRPDGLVNSKQALNRANPGTMIKESAQLLAHTMYQARDIDYIRWYSDWNGSEVLTQAMQILTKQNVKLDKHKHTVLLNHPTTRPSKALDLGRELGLTPFEGGVISKGIPTPKEIIGRLGFLDMPISSVQRLIKKQASPKQALISTTEKAFSLTGTTSSVIGLLGSVGLIQASPIAGAVGSAWFVTSLIVKAYKGRRKRN